MTSVLTRVFGRKKRRSTQKNLNTLFLKGQLKKAAHLQGKLFKEK